MKKFKIWMPIIAVVISLFLLNGGEYSVLLVFINPILLILGYLIDDTTTNAYKIINENISIITIISTGVFYFLIGLLIDNIKSKSNNK